MDGNYKIVFFIDDDISLSGRSLKGIPIINLDKFISLPNIEIDHVLMAIPSLNKKKFNSIVSKLYELNLKVLRVPSLSDLTSGRAKIDNLSPISIYDLLSRQNVNYIKELYGPKMKNKCICITGAGGSIGSELSNQILKLKPSSLVLIDHDEFSLYKLNQKLIKKIDNVELFFRLGSAINKNLFLILLKN